MINDLGNHMFFGTAHRQNPDSNATLGGVAAWEIQLGS